MARTNKQDIRKSLEALCRGTGLNLSIGIWAPGDGKKRYRLTLNEDGGVRDLGPVFMGTSTFEDALRMAIAVANEMRRNPR